MTTEDQEQTTGLERKLMEGIEVATEQVKILTDMNEKLRSENALLLLKQQQQQQQQQQAKD